MAIPAPYQLRLNTNYIDASIEALKVDILQILEPHLERIVEAHMDRTIKYVPAHAERVRQHRAEIKNAIITYTVKLLKNPFDEAWVADAEARAAFEIRIGFDMRTRPVINQRLLSEFIGILGTRHRFSGAKIARLARAALHIFALDNATSAADMNAPGWQLHPLRGELRRHWAVTVSGNWRLTFTFKGKDAVLVDYQDYH